MSHFTKIKTKLYDLVTIEKSLSDLNIEWESGAEKIRGYNNKQHAADIVIRQNIITILVLNGTIVNMNLLRI